MARVIAAIVLALAIGTARAQPSASDAFDESTQAPGDDVFAPRVLQGAKRPPEAPSDDRLVVTPHVSGTAAALAMRNNQFAPPPVLLPSGIVLDPQWAELFLEAAITAKYAVSQTFGVYGGLAYLESATRGHDYSTNGNTTHGLAELAYAGVTVNAAANLVLDVSYGQQDFKVSNGMLLWQGATNGVQRGAAFIAPRTAWADALLAKVTYGDMAVTAFHLEPNEAQALQTGTRIAGINAQWNPAGPLHAGFMYLHVPQSDIVTRDGLDVYDLRFRWHPLPAVTEFWLQGEYVYQHKSNVAAQGGYLQANYNAKRWTWKPAIALQWTWLSGDNPQTSRWEGFDPLYYGNSNPNWYPGTLASTLFNNTNLVSTSVTLTLNPADAHILQFWLIDFRAAVANSPLAIPAPGGGVPVGGGVPAKPLATELDASWTWQLTKAVNLTVLGAFAVPGSGYRDLYSNFGGAAASWRMIGTQINVAY